jgi:hypothetical protein
MAKRSVPGEARKARLGASLARYGAKTVDLTIARTTDRKEFAKNSVRENITSHACPSGCACGIYDIVKRRSIRVWDLRSNSRFSIHYLQDISALAHRKMCGL